MKIMLFFCEFLGLRLNVVIMYFFWGLEFGDGLVKGSWLSGCFEEVEEGFFEVGVKG